MRRIIVISSGQNQHAKLVEDATVIRGQPLIDPLQDGIELKVIKLNRQQRRKLGRRRP